MSVALTTHRLRVIPKHCCFRLTREVHYTLHDLAGGASEVRVEDPLFQRHHNTRAFFEPVFGRRNESSLLCKSYLKISVDES
jgi:hypothetical protein